VIRPGRRRSRPAGLARRWGIALFIVLLVAGTAATLAVADTNDFFGGRDEPHLTVPGPQAAALRSPQLSPRPARPGVVDVYAHTRAGMLSPTARRAKYLIYVPDSQGNGVYVIDPHHYKVIGYYATGAEVQHVVPAWDERNLYATNDVGNSLTPFDPNTGRPAGPSIPVTDPYNMYFTPDGGHAIVVEEAQAKLAFRDPHTFAIQKELPVNCPGVDHMDFSAHGRFALASCEFSGQMVKINLRTEKVAGYVNVGGSPQDVKLSPDGRTFYVANKYVPSKGASGIQLIDARTLKITGFLPTRLDAHGLYVSRNGRYLYATSRAGGSVNVIDFATRRIVAVWPVPGTPDMGGVSPDGKVLWLAGRGSAAVYAISTRNGHMLASIPVGVSPHGLCVWPQPGRYSTGHTGVMR
jgi:DNA-binding beta-propeller fold protein YncE